MGVAAGIAGAAVLSVVGYFAYQAMQPGAETAAMPSPVVQPGATQVNTGPAEAPPTVTEHPPTDPAPSPGTTAPEFDLVRVDPTGAALVAGRAAPGQVVRVIVDEIEVAQAVSDGSGNFVAMFTMQGHEAPSVVSLSAGEERLASAQTVIVTPTAPPPARVAMEEGRIAALAPSPVPASAPAPAPVANAVDAGADPVGTAPSGASTTVSIASPATAAPTDAPTFVSELPFTPPQTSPEAPFVRTAENVEGPSARPAGHRAAPPSDPQAEPAAPQVLLADENGLTVLQDAGETPPEVMEAISLDTISYDEEGAVALTGRGREDRHVLVYLNNALIRTVRVSRDGQWHAPLPDVARGVYTLRVDEVDEGGTVISRSETPFKREQPAALVAAAVAVDPAAPGRLPIERITVQPGATLWAIAREKYGKGTMYVQVFAANRDRIRDPDLIYPGQVFDLPDP
ncbi:MAG: peptigoglycan-binding protein LysM [Rhodobacterales bacterium]|nr:MAG: peptigoglycan-binding protein LysM [Rhodobacterales bacterium]